MGKISGEEGLISLGPWGIEGGEYWAYKADGPIMQITIHYGGVIDSIVFESKSSSGVLIGSPSEFGGRGGPNKETFCIDTSVEQLSSISLEYGDYGGDSAIGSLYFNTDQNTYGVTGNCTWNFSFVSIPIKSGVIAGFHGRAESYINAFGMFVAPKVDHKGKNSCEEGSISLGPWGGEDGVDWAYKLDRPITQITIRYGAVIESIVFESKSYDGVVIEGSVKIGGDGGHNAKTFCIDSSVEQVSSIFVTYGEFNKQVTIHSLCINTNLNEYGASGSRTGAFSVSIPLEGGVLVGFHGRLANYITAIGIFVAPKVNSLSSPQKKVDSLLSIQDPDSAPSQLKGKISDKEAELKKQISGEKEWISIGPCPWRVVNHAYWDYKPNGPILQICILYGDVIDSIVFASKSYDGVVIGSCKKIGNSTRGHRTNTISIDTSAEQLLSISLTYENDHGQYGQVTIISLSIHTNLNNYGPFGAREAASCVCIPIVGGVFAGFHGRVGKYITTIGVFVAPKVNSLLSIQDLDSAPKKDLDAAPTQHKGKNSCEEGSISLGPWGGEDGVDWAYKLNGPIMQITIRYGRVIESIVFKSKSDDGAVIEGSVKIGGDGGDKIETFCIDSSKEQVSSIMLTFRASWMNSLRINTNLRTYGPFGSSGGTSSVSIPIEGGVLTGFHGRLGPYINAIGVFVAPKINSTLPSSGKKVDGLHSVQDSDSSTSKLKGKISDKEAEQKKEISGKEGCLSLGPWGGEYGKNWVYKPDGRLLQICILYGEAIYSIVFASKSYDGVVIGSCKKIGRSGGSGIETICIDTAVEELLSISLAYELYNEGVRIISFSIHTNLNKYGPFGSRSGASSLSIPIKGGVFAGLHGRVGTYITAIGVLLTPKANSLLSIQDLDSAPKKDPDATPTHHKGKNSGEEGSISLGPWGGEDGVDWAYKLDRPITQIRIRYGYVIESIVFESKSYDGDVIEGSEKIGGDGGDKIETFCIDSSKEQVSSIILTFGEFKREVAIHTLGINTNLRTYGPFGSRTGASSVSIPIEGGVLTGFHGRLGRYINAIGVFVAPKINTTLPSSGKEVDGLHSVQDSDSSTSQLKGKISDKEAEQKKEISGKEGCISLGPWGGEDGKDWVYKPDGPLLHICIVYGEAIDSIAFASKSYDGVVIGSCKKIGRNGGNEIETICIDTSVEELLSINLTYEDYYGQVSIISFSIHTNRNKYGPFGWGSGASSLSIPIKGGVFAGLRGRVGTYITAIGVLLTPKVNSLLSIQDLDSAPKKDPDAVPTHHKGKISNEEGWISIGPWGGKDGVDWAYKPDGPIMQISICYGEVINSILFRSRRRDGLVIGSSQKIGNTDGHTTETFCIQSSAEQLLSIRMTYDEDDGKATIVSLCFNTNLNKYGPFGTKNGSCSLIIPIGGVIAGFHGRVDTYLTAIGIFLTPKVNSLHPIQDPDYAPINLKAKISGEEGWISLGPWGGNGGVDWAYKPDGPIMQISIRYGELIESIIFESRSCDDIVIGSSVKIGNMGGYATEKFCIHSSAEQLSSIIMTFDDDNGKVTIVSLCFITTLKKEYGPFGSKSGASSVSIPIDGGFIAGFHGRIDSHLTAIGIFVAPKVNTPDKISDEEGCISLGPWGGKDGQKWAYKYEGPIMQINICYGAAINSLLFRSRSCDGLIIGSSEKIGGTGGHTSTTKKFFIDTSAEQLSSISLTSEHYDGKMTITSLCFNTNLKTYGPFGTISGSSLSIPIEGGVVTGFHGRTDTGSWEAATEPGAVQPHGAAAPATYTYLTAIGIFLAPKVSSLSIQGPDSTPTQLKVPDSGLRSKPKTLENVIHNAASSSTTTNKDDDCRRAPSPFSETIRKDLHFVAEQKKALQLVDSAFHEYKIHMDKQISEARKKLEELEKLGSSESEFVELGEAIEKLKFQIPLTSTNKEDHLDGVLSPNSKMIRSDLILLDTAYAKANEAKYQAHEKLKELQTLQSSERDSNELQKAESDKKRKELRKAMAKLKVQTSSRSKIRSANSNLQRNNWPNINSAMDGMMHFFYKEPDVPHTIDDGILEAFSKLPEPLRCCLSCFFKFPPMATIKRTPMMYLWIGQGYVSQYLHSEGYDSDVEELADKIFDDLIEKGFIEPIYQNFSLVPDSCRMSLTVRSSLHEEAKLRGFTSNANGALDLDPSAVCRDLIQHSSCLINVGEAIINCEPEIFKNMKHIRSLYLGRWQSSAMYHIELEDAKLLHGLCKLKSLTFLSLRGISMITELPKLILELNDLMILDLRACSNLEVIPDKIGLLKRLTHLDMSECYFLENMPKSLAQLSNLQVLKGFMIGDFNNKKQSCTLHDLSGLQKLRKLNIHISVEDLLRLQDLEHLERFGGLKKLTISWGRLQARAEVIAEAFHSATIPPTLEKLDLQCFPMTSLSNWLMPGKLKELKKLYIRGGKLRDLGEIQKRQRDQWTVEILRFEYLGELELYWKELRTLFPKLIYLRQVECPNFINFQFDETGVWMNKEAIVTHMQLQKYVKFSGMIGSSSTSGSGPTLAQDDSN